MSIASSSTRYTPEDLLQMQDGDRYELVDGQLVERGVSKWSSYVAGRIFALLYAHSQQNKLGWVLPEGASFQCFPADASKVRRADVSFLRAGRLSPQEIVSPGHFQICPDLAVEVVSPHDLAYDVDEKVQDYLQAGVQLVWVVNPQSKTVQVHRLRGEGSILHADDTLDGEDILPGFRCPVHEFYALPEGIA